MERLYIPPEEGGELAAGRRGGFGAADAAKKIGKIIPAELVTAFGALVSG